MIFYITFSLQVWFGLVSLFYGISTFLGYLIPDSTCTTVVVVLNP